MAIQNAYYFPVTSSAIPVQYQTCVSELRYEEESHVSKKTCLNPKDCLTSVKVRFLRTQTILVLVLQAGGLNHGYQLRLGQYSRLSNEKIGCLLRFLLLLGANVDVYYYKSTGKCIFV